MEHNTILLTNLPNEILYYLAKYIDLLDLGALLFTSKSLNALLQTDLAFQKIVCNATSMRLVHSKLDRPIRVVYYDKLASVAVKYNDPKIMEYSLEKITVEHIISKLRPKKGYIQSKSQEKDLATQIISNDADKVLEYLVEECKRSAEKSRKSFTVEKIFNFLIDACFGTNVPPVECTFSKVIEFVLKFIDENRKLLLRVLIERITIEPSAFALLEGILKYQIFHEYPLKFNEPIEIRKGGWGVAIECEATILEAAAFYGLKNVFHLLIDNGAIVDPKKPYLPLLCVRHRFANEFFDLLVKLGADLNAPLPEGFARNVTTILGFAATQQDLGDCGIEFLLIKGAKLSEEESSRFLATKDTSCEYNVAIAQIDHYDPKNRTTQFDVGLYRLFRTHNGFSDLTFTPEGNFKHKAKNRIGTWKQDTEGRLSLTSRERLQFVNYGSYGMVEQTVKAELVEYEFLVYRNYRNMLALLPIEKDSSLSVHGMLFLAS